ncbi:MAG TPA: cytochrome P450 [Myxococcota bacterium]|nr:cytochrome P450 [Myxococcota bacterium]
MSGPVEYDPFSYEIDVDPYPVYKRMRDEAPAYYNPRLDFWALTRFDDCHDALVDWQTYSSAEGTVLELMGSPMIALSGLMIFMDPPRQTRYRNLVSKAFTPARIRALEPRIREITTRYLDRLVGRPSFDVVAEFTAKLPMDVISSMLGIPEADRDAVRGWSNDVLHRDAGNPLPTAQGLQSMGRLMEYFNRHVEERRKRPQDDMMTALVEAELDGQRLDDNDLRNFMNLLATAGNETVTKLLATAFYWLPRFPDQRRILAEDPAACETAVEELLRFDPPSQYQGRTLTRDVELRGATMPKGAKVMIVNGASGRDERRFPDPDRLDVRRDIEFHLGFGYGRHICLGAYLARMETRIALEEFHRRWPVYETPDDGVVRMHSSNVRGLSGLRVEVR